MDTLIEFFRSRGSLGVLLLNTNEKKIVNNNKLII